MSEGKELAGITELICDHCLAPDTDSDSVVGCDNMTIIVIALLHGRTKEEWCSWIKDRVENSIGYKTPNYLPQLYSSYRIKFSVRDKRPRNHAEPQPSVAKIDVNSSEDRLQV